MEVARELAAGTMLDGKYRIERLLAVGGMGAVYVGTHVALRKKVAIKVLNPQLTNEAMIQRFHREAITASQIGHEGIAQVTDLGTSNAGEPFLVMELLEGESLASRLKTSGALPVELASELGCAILSPLAAAHAAGIVHRDLKPDNVFLVRQSRGEMVKLLDFGISRGAHGQDGELRLTNTGVVMGTPYYMSPEQARGDSEITPAADIYSFGVMLYEMLLAKLPITGENYNQLIWRVMNGEFEAPRIRRPDLPAELEQIILRAMASDPNQRWTSATELEHALLAFCRPNYREHMIERMSNAGIPWGTPAGHRPSQPAYSTPVQQLAGTDPALLAPTGMMPAKRRSVLPLVLIGLVLVVGGGTAAFVATRSSEPTSTSAPASAPAQAATPDPVAAPAPAAAPTPMPTTPVPTPPASRAPRNITINVVPEPASAQILLDGQPVQQTIQRVADGAEHSITISAPGYVSRTEKVRFDENQRLVVTLPKERTVTKKVPVKTGDKRPPKQERIDSQSPYE